MTIKLLNKSYFLFVYQTFILFYRIINRFYNYLLAIYIIEKYIISSVNKNKNNNFQLNFN